MKSFSRILIAAVLIFSSLVHATPLESWNEGVNKNRILQFVESVTNEKSKNYVTRSERIAVFDNDGTLWSEQPLYFQAIFMVQRLKALSTRHPEWKDQQPYKAFLEEDFETIKTFSEHDLAKIWADTHTGMSPDEFRLISKEWLQTAKHPRFNRLFKELVYQPMLELLQYLRAEGFKTYIVTGGENEFVRAFAEEVYGIPPEQVIGSSTKLQFSSVNDRASLLRLPEINNIDDGPGKPMNISMVIGRIPILAFGNSDGDLQMLQYSTSSLHSNLQLLLHHDDEAREYAYDRSSKIGKLDKALDEGLRRNWVIVSIKKDFKAVYP